MSENQWWTLAIMVGAYLNGWCDAKTNRVAWYVLSAVLIAAIVATAR